MLIDSKISEDHRIASSTTQSDVHIYLTMEVGKTVNIT